MSLLMLVHHHVVGAFQPPCPASGCVGQFPTLNGPTTPNLQAAPPPGGGPTGVGGGPSIITNSGNAADIPGQVLLFIGAPILLVAEILIPAAIAVSAIHKLSEHRESAMSTIVDLVVKGGGTILAIELIKSMIN